MKKMRRNVSRKRKAAPTKRTRKPKQNRKVPQNERNSVAAVTDTASDLLVALDREGRIVRFNEACRQLTGYSAEEVKGRRPCDFLVVPEEKTAARETFQRALGGSPSETESHWLTKDGRRVLIAWSVSGLVRGSRKESVIATGVDRAAYEKARRWAREIEAAVRPLLETAAQMILAIDQDRRIVLANTAGERMFGYGRDELIGRGIEELIPERFRERCAQSMTKWFSQPRNRPTGMGLELAALRKDGIEFPVDIRLSFIGTNEGTLGVLFVSDITERKKSEQALTEQKTQLAFEVSTLVRLREASDRLWRSHELRAGLEEIIDAGMAQLGADMGNIQLLNPKNRVLEIVAHRGFDPDFLEHFREVSAADSSACGRSLRTRQRILVEDVDADPAYAPHRAIVAAAGYRAVQCTPLFGKDGEPMGMFSTHFRRPHRPSDRDLRRFDLYADRAAEFIERLRAEQQLRNLGAMLSAQEMGNRELARELHDVFSQELAALAMEVSTLRTSRKADGPLSERLGELGRKIGRLAEQMHDASRRLHPAILHELGLKAALREECDKLSASTGIPILFKCEKLPASLPDDVSLCLYRIAQESLLNIRKHAGATDARLWLKGKGGGVGLRIEDTGDGFNVADVRSSGGLGLVSMEERVRLVNGIFEIRSQPGQGTTVEVFVPLNKDVTRRAKLLKGMRAERAT